MIQGRKRNRFERDWSEEAVILARASRPFLFDALQTLRAPLVDASDEPRYEYLFTQAEGILDNTEDYKLLSAAQELLIRTRCPPTSSEAARDVAQGYAHTVLVALFYNWRHKAA